MILTDREIKHSLGSGLISITPLPDKESYSSTSVDLTLAQTIRTFRPGTLGLDAAVDPAIPGFDVMAVIRSLSEERQIDPAEGYVLGGRSLILAWTRERVQLHEHGRVAARVEGKSSLARLGLAVHVTAPTIHCGFKAPSIQLEIINHGPLPIRLRTGMRICQLIFEQTLGMPEHAYEGQFRMQGPAPA
ncbi:dCTP deaminase [Methylobacterium sp. A54F]